MAAYEVAQILVGLVVFGVAVLPRVLSDKPMSFPMLFVTLGVVLFSLPIGIEYPHPRTLPDVTELLSGYGFIAVFVAAITLRHYEWDHEYYHALNDFAVMVERLLMALVLVLFGGAIAGGLLAPLSAVGVAVGVVLVFVVRPLAGIVGQIGPPTRGPNASSSPRSASAASARSITSPTP